MDMDKRQIEGCWISVIMRLAIATLLGAAAVSKFTGGLNRVVGYFQDVFSETWLPLILVTLHARIVPFAELIICVWLVIGWRLRAAWVVAGLFLISLAFGMVVAAKYDTAAHNYVYVALCCIGIYFSAGDRWSVDGFTRRPRG